MQTMRDTMTSRPGTITRPSTVAVASTKQPSADSPNSRVFGVMLAAGVSATFWMGVLAVGLPAISVFPTALALALTGLGIAGFVSASLIAIRTAN